MGWESNSVFQVLIITGSAGSGVFVYSPRPGAGNLVASVAAAAGTDPFGNAYLAGEASYGPSNIGRNYAVSIAGNALNFWTAPVASNGAGPWTLAGSAALDTTGTILLFTGPSGGLSLNRLLAAGGGLQVVGGETTDTLTVTTGLAAGLLLQVTNTTGGATSELARYTVQTAGDGWHGFRVAGDTANRLILDATVGGLARIRFGPGNAAPDLSLQRLGANALGLTTADFAIENAGRGLQVKEGANAKQGTATLAAGTVTVANTSVTASSRIFLTAQDNNTTGALRVSARTAGTSFVITSSNAADTGVVAYELFEPAP